MRFTERLREGQLVLLDGAMGTEVQRLGPSAEEWNGCQGCTEILNLTAPSKVQSIHERYLQAGADVVETNTFGANEVVLSEYGLQSRTEEINFVAATTARRAIDSFDDRDRPRFVAGSVGPGTKLVSLEQISCDDLYRSYVPQSRGLIRGGIDLFLIETCQDLLQAKSCLRAVRDTQEKLGVDLPIIVSVTIESTGTMLLGTEIGAAIVALEPLEIDAMGINCATGPDSMSPHVRQLAQQFPGPILVMPNAGLPQNVDGQMVYTLTREDFVATMLRFIQQDGVQLVGGCCGTTPEFIRLLHDATREVSIVQRQPQMEPSVASLYSAQTLTQRPAPMFVGERTNTNGSRKFRRRLLKDDWEGVLAVALEQQRAGAHALDLCVAYTGRDEVADMGRAVSMFNRQVQLPLMIDSTNVEAIEAALKRYGGRATINSINLEDGEGRADDVCRLARRYGAALIALTIDEEGMALQAERKVAIAKRICEIATERHGMRPQDLIFDALTFTLGSGDQKTRDAAMQTLEAVRRIKSELPGVHTILGVSNISFGLSPHSRTILNSIFLAEAVKAGLDTAIVNVRDIIPLHEIDEDDRTVAMDLLFDRGAEPLFKFIEHFEDKDGRPRRVDEQAAMSLEERIGQCVISGSREGLQAMLQQKLQSSSAIKIVNQLLIPAMKVVGELFGAGEMQLPFVLQSAEVMKYAVDVLRPHMEKSEEVGQTSIVLATVRGDVHDIGKNLVDIILSNNGYRVHNLGIKCEIEVILNQAREVGADAIGMSGLLVKSTVVMKENLEYLRQRGCEIPVLLGGAALTRRYVEQTCDPILDTPVVYCSDAFAGLRVMNLIQEGNLDAAVEAERVKRAVRPLPRPQVSRAAHPDEISRDVDIPTPPFWGDRVVADVGLSDVFSYITEQVLFRGRWGYRRGKLSREQYDELILREVRPRFEQLKAMCSEQQLFVPQLVYGYYPCNADGDEVIVYHPHGSEEWFRFRFPRQARPPHRCIADFFLPSDSARRDLIALQVATIGPRADEWAHQLYNDNRYKDYLLFHGLSVETAEALAEMWHRQIRQELNIAAEDGAGIEDYVRQQYRGSRYSFGYPACPSLEENEKILAALRPERIGVTLTESGQMVPEQTTSAFIVHHPQAKYFTVD